VDLVRAAKARGLPVTAEVTPHHLLLSEEDVPAADPAYKMNPPLRTKEDQAALLAGLQDGTIDVIATDHAPHAADEKKLTMLEAPFGVVGLEIAFPLLYTHLVCKDKITLPELLAKLTISPAKILGLRCSNLGEGQLADLTVIDLKTERRVEPSAFLSKGRSTPFNGWLLKGWPVLTLVEGKVAWQHEDLGRMIS
jgi:dihydroorotase